MRQVSVISRNSMAGLGFKLPVIWLVAALLGFLLGALTAPYVPLVSNTILVSAPSRDVAHGARPGLQTQKQQEQNEAGTETPQVVKPSGPQRRTSTSSGEQVQVEEGSEASAGSTDQSGRDGKVGPGGDLVIVEEVGSPPPNCKQPEDDEHAPQLAQADVLGSARSTTCDLFEGRWVPDPEGPLYRHDTCPVLSGMQNCQANGRPDKGYQYWRWQPANCSLPRFDPHVFLDVMRGKTLAFVGDSVARNHMESLMCALMQAEQPRSHGNKKMQKWVFPTHAVTVIRIWSSWLVQATFDAVDVAPGGPMPKLHLDQPDAAFDAYLPTFDVVVVSGGHWFVKRAAFVVADQVVGGQLWTPPPPATPTKTPRNFTVDYTAAFGTAMRTALRRLASHPTYRGLTVLRTYSPDHYAGGAWDSGGSCTGRRAPTEADEFRASQHTALMRRLQVDAYDEAVRVGGADGDGDGDGDGASNGAGSRFRLMDVTAAFEYRGDGHPGPYRSPDPRKQTAPGPGGKPPPQDCLHWCMPGPVDTWNAFLLEMLKQDFSSSPG